MKKLLCIFFTICCFATAFAQAPNQSDGSTPIPDPPDDVVMDTCKGISFNPKKQKCDCLCGIIGITESCNKKVEVTLNCPASACKGLVTSITCQPSIPGGNLSVSVSGSLMLMSASNSPNIQVKGTAGGTGTVSVTYTICDKSATASCTIDIIDKITLTGIDSINACPKQAKGAVVDGSPAGGLYSWSASGGVTITGATNQATVDFVTPATTGVGMLTASYSVCNTTVYHNISVKTVEPSVKLNVADTIQAAIGQQITITPTVTPSTGQVQWSVSNGLTLNSGPYNYVAFITVLDFGGQYRTATIRVTVCGIVITKTVVIKVNPCVVNVSVPDSVYVIANATIDITAYGNMEGTYAWAAGGKVSILGAANNQTVTVKGDAVGVGYATVTFTGKSGCKATKKVKVIVIAKPTLSLAPTIPSMCKGERRIINATYQPAGGTFTWSLSSNSLGFYGPAGNSPTVVVEAKKGGDCTLTCTYTVNGQSATATLACTVREYSKIELTASNNAAEVKPGTTITYTAKVYDHNGQLTTTPLHWKVVYIPIGQEGNAGNWVSYDLQGNGPTQTHTWGFPQGNYPLPGIPPFKMRAWIEAAEYCTYKSGSIHLLVVKDDTCEAPTVKINNCNATSYRVDKINTMYISTNPTGGALNVSVSGNLQLLSAANDRNVRVKGTAIGAGTITATYTFCQKTATDQCNVDVKEKLVLTGPDTVTTCINTLKGTAVQGTPDGGLYSWTAGNGVTIVGPSNESGVQFKTTAQGASTLTASYTLDGETVFHTVHIKTATPSVKLNVPDTILAAINQSITITPTLTPSGSVQWSVSNGLTLTSGPYNFVAFVKVGSTGPQYRTVTLRATICGQVITKTVVIKVNPCIVNVDVPDSVYVLTNQTTSITATGNTNGAYSWSVTGKAEANGATNQATVSVKGKVAGVGWAEVTFTANNCKTTKKVKVIVIDKPTLTLDIAYAPMATMCKGERRIITARYQPAGGSFNWTLGSNSLEFYGPAGNNPTIVVEAKKGGNSSVTCTYTVNGQSATASINTEVKEYSKIELVAGNDAKELAQGTTVTYTARAYDHNGQLTATPALHWKVVYIPVGQEANVGNWVSMDLQGNGDTKTYTWGFPQGNHPLPGNPPYKMTAWIEAVEYCTYKSGSIHIKVIKNP